MKRNETIDITRGVAALMVVFFHTIQRFPNSGQNIIFHICFSVQIPLFFLISGYNALSSRRINNFSALMQHLSKRILQLLIPWFVWSSIYYWIYYHDTPVLDYIATTAFNMTRAYWFLVSLWTIDAFHSIASFISNKNNKIIFYFFTQIVCVGLLVLIGIFTDIKFLGIQYTLYYTPFFILGYIYAYYKDSLILLSKSTEVITSIFCLVYFLFIVRYGYTNIPYNSYYILLRVILSIIGSIVLIVSIKKINWENKSLIKNILLYSGKYSLEIYVLHLIILPLLNVGQYESSTIFGFILCIINYILVFIATTTLIKLFNSNKYTRLILFGKK